MSRKNVLIFTLVLAITSAVPAVMVKADDIKPVAVPKLISAPVVPNKGFTTNQLKPYVLNNSEVQAVLGKYSDVIEKLKFKTGYYVFDNAKYGIEDSNVYVMISLGQRNSTGYGIKVISVEDIEGISKITIQEKRPSPDEMVGDAITYPYVIVKFAQGTPNVRVATDTGEELPIIMYNLEQEEQGWKDLKPRYDVPEDKEWLITFKKNFQPEVINNDTIYVKDSNGVTVQTKLITNKSNKNVRVIPVEKYLEGETYYLFISNKVSARGYRMMFTIEGAVTVEDPVKEEANAYLVSSKFENVPLYDAVTDKQAGTLFKDFTVNLSNIKDDKAYFSIPVADSMLSGNVTQKDYYVPVKCLEKTYKEPFIIPMIISTDMIKIKGDAPIYLNNDGTKQCIMKFSQEIGPIHFIMKTSNGYMFTLANNLVFVNPEDVEYIKN